jgi:hypothetical protein
MRWRRWFDPHPYHLFLGKSLRLLETTATAVADRSQKVTPLAYRAVGRIAFNRSSVPPAQQAERGEGHAEEREARGFGYDGGGALELDTCRATRSNKGSELGKIDGVGVVENIDQRLRVRLHDVGRAM